MEPPFNAFSRGRVTKNPSNPLQEQHDDDNEMALDASLSQRKFLDADESTNGITSLNYQKEETLQEKQHKGNKITEMSKQ